MCFHVLLNIYNSTAIATVFNIERIIAHKLYRSIDYVANQPFFHDVRGGGSKSVYQRASTSHVVVHRE
jgi:hypothetical protein